jgi:hypothetical protein
MQGQRKPSPYKALKMFVKKTRIYDTATQNRFERPWFVPN